MKTLGIAIGLSLAFATTWTLAPAEAAAQTACRPHDNVVGHLAKKYGEAPVAIGVTNKGSLVEVLTTGDGNTWTIIVTLPNGTSCLVAAGEGWSTREYDSMQAAPST